MADYLAFLWADYWVCQKAALMVCWMVGQKVDSRAVQWAGWKAVQKAGWKVGLTDCLSVGQWAYSHMKCDHQ